MKGVLLSRFPNSDVKGDGPVVVVDFVSFKVEVVPAFKLTTEESGGPPVTVPQRKGFGSLLIERSFLGDGEASLDFRPDGFRCLLEISLQ